MLLGDLFEEEKPRRKSIPKAVRDTVWSKYIGASKAEGKCYVCRRTIHITDFDIGHNKAVTKGGKNHINNLRPICRSCNSSMGTMSIERFKTKYFSIKREKASKVTATKKKKRRSSSDWWF